MTVEMRIYIAMGCMLFALVCGLLRWWLADRSVKWLCIFLAVNLLTELLALYYNYRYHFNLYVYNLLNPVGMFCATLYFNYSNRLFTKHRLGIIAGIVGLLFAVINIMYFQPLNASNSNFTSFECLVLSALALAYFYSTFFSETKSLKDAPHFWIAFLFLFYYAGTFLIRAGVNIVKHYPDSAIAIHQLYWVIFILVVLFYSGIGIILLRFKSFKP